MGDDHVPTLECTVRDGEFALHARATWLGRDLVVCVGGGDRPHVGCVALAQPHPSTADTGRTSATASLLAIPPHREGALASDLALRLARAFNAVVVVAAGVHTDDLTPAGIQTFLRLGEELGDELIARLGR